MQSCSRLTSLTDFDPIMHLNHAVESRDCRLRELLLMEGGNLSHEGENSIIETASDTTDGAVRAVLQADLRCFGDVVSRFLLASIHVN
jgi:hypothetical protein